MKKQKKTVRSRKHHWLKYISKPRILLSLAIATIVILIVMVIWLALISRSIDRGPLGDRSGALQRAGELRRLSNIEAQKEIIAAIIDSGDLSKCDIARDLKIDGYDYGSVCRNNVASRLAMERMDAAYCGKLDGQLFDSRKCQSDVILKKAILSHLPSICSELSDDSSREQCQSSFWVYQSLENKEISYCDQINNLESRTSCRENYIVEDLILSGTTNCDQANDPGLRDDCRIYKKAVEKSDVDLCAEIKLKRLRTICQRL